VKTTVEISDPLLRDTRRVAAREGTTVRALIEEGLRRVLGGRRRRGQFRLRDASYGEGGLRPELRGADWDCIREMIYQGRGG
jgi:hypothetical protein